MPRRNRPKGKPRDEEPEERPIALGSTAHAPTGWQARVVQPMNATKRYVCPGCEGSVEPATKHIVAWPLESESYRRHWHEHCWSAAVRSGRRLPT